MQKIIVLGGGGHAKVLIDLIKIKGNLEIVGILDTQLEKGTKVLDVPVLGKDNILADIFNNGVNTACIGIGGIKDNNIRSRLFDTTKNIGFEIPSLIHPNSFISRESTVAEGVQVMAGAVIQTNSFIDENSIINTGSTIDHDCVVGKNTHICPGVVIGGGATIGDASFIGAGSTIIQGVKIGNNSVVGAGAVVTNDVSDGLRVKGVPAKIK